MGSNIILVGMPACGKTTIGAMLADKLPEYIHIDIDSLIEKTQGLSICEIFQKYSEDYFRKLEYDTIKLAIVGKPNAGKSSLINRLVGESRVIVSSIAGTTRDSVDIPFKYNGKKYSLIDTAGMRRKSKIEDDTIERYSIIRTLDSIRSCDVAVLVIDVTDEITDQDLKITHFIDEQNKPFVIVFNKWDLIDKDSYTMDKFEEKVRGEFAFVSFYKSVYLSALTGKRIEKLMQAVEEVLQKKIRVKFLKICLINGKKIILKHII